MNSENLKSIIYISKRCPHCRRLLLLLQSKPDLIGSIQITCIDDEPFPNIIKTVPTMISDGQLFNAKQIFDMLEEESKSLLEKELSLPAYDQCLKASHVFNILDARGVISVAQRAEYISRIREITKNVGKIWLKSQTK